MARWSEQALSYRRLIDATEQAAQIYTRPSRRRAAVHYLENRGIRAGDLSEHWRLGYAPSGWTRLVDEMRPLGFDDETLLGAGLARMSSRGTLIDYFRDRVVLPVRNEHAETVGFIGRDLSGADNAPKYLNSPSSNIFDKSRELFGLHEARGGGRLVQPVIVEGPLDVLAIAARQGRRADGHLLPVAASGTAFTSRQAVSVANANALDGRPVVVAMDGDDAGRHAALRAGERLRIAGCDVRIASLPNGADPASYLTDERHDLSIFETRSAVPLLGAQVARVLADQGDHMQWAEGKVAASRIIANYLTGYPPDRAVENAGWIANALEMEPSTFAGVLGVAFREARALPPAGDRAGDLLREAADLAVPSRDLASVSPLRRTW